MVGITQMAVSKGWADGISDYDFLDIWQCGINAQLVYEGRGLYFQCESRPALIRYDDNHGEIIASFCTEEEFYNAVIFNKPIQQIVDESYFKWWD